MSKIKKNLTIPFDLTEEDIFQLHSVNYKFAKILLEKTNYGSRVIKFNDAFESRAAFVFSGIKLSNLTSISDSLKQKIADLFERVDVIFVEGIQSEENIS